MQILKGNSIAGLLLLSSGVVQAAPSTSVAPTQESGMQEHIQKMVEEDYRWEAQKRAVANELELEKMNSEIRKLRGEDRVSSMPQLVIDTSPKESGSTQVSNGSPHILLESNIGGLSRVAVGSADGSTLLYVSPGDRFTLNGHQYQLIRDKKSGLVIKEAGQ